MIVGIITSGTYYCPWFPHTLTSIYKKCNKIIVVNSGHDLNNFDKNVWNVPLPQVTSDIKKLDINGKVTEYRGVTMDDIRHKHDVMSQVEMDSTHRVDVYDIRGIVGTFATQKAYESGAEWVLKIDHDQVQYPDWNSYDGGSFMSYQYEFGDKIESPTAVNTEYPYNDGTYTYKPYAEDWYQGSQAPALKSEGQNQRLKEPRFHSAHLRFCKPSYLTDNEWKNFLINRELWNVYNNETNKFDNKLPFIVADRVNFIINKYRNLPKHDIAPPQICMSSPDELVRFLQ